MKFSLVVAAALLTSAACTKANPKSCIDGHCSDPDLPFCDVDGAIEGEPNTCIAVTCSAGEFVECRDDKALTCNANGDNLELVQCEFGCSEDGCKVCDTPECEKHIIPRYLPAACDALSDAGPLAIMASDALIDTSNDLNCTAVVQQASGPEICVLHHTEILVAQNRTLRVTGTRALALVADRELSIVGTLDASADGRTNGPGGGMTKSGSCTNVGGGGAGGRTAGGAGGTTVDGGAMNGGAAQTNAADLTTLHGGAQSAAGSCVPGGGGGALTLISCRGPVAIAGLIDAGGGGGAESDFQQQGTTGTYRYAGGGGAGGTVVLQGMTLSVTGQLVANGGGGGGACDGPCFVMGPFSGPGDDGLRSTARANGGAGEALGGAGGAAVGQPFPGRAGDSFGGGGGGSGGFLLTFTPAGVTPAISPTLVSPPLEANGTIPTN